MKRFEDLAELKSLLESHNLDPREVMSRGLHETRMAEAQGYIEYQDKEILKLRKYESNRAEGYAAIRALQDTRCHHPDELLTKWEDGAVHCWECEWDKSQNEITNLKSVLEAVRSQMCWEKDRDQLTMGFSDLHNSVTEALKPFRKETK